MNFTLEQLTPETVTMLFENAYYKAENNIYTNDEGVEQNVGTIVYSGNRRSVIYADVSERCVNYRLTLFLSEEQASDRKRLLEVCNVYDDFPVHASVKEYADSETAITFIYKHIVPEGVDISPKELVGVFRVFEKHCGEHEIHFNSLAQSFA